MPMSGRSYRGYAGAEEMPIVASSLSAIQIEVKRDNGDFAGLLMSPVRRSTVSRHE
jgi:hypothetical protein